MTMRIGLIGCGYISDIYLTNASLFRDIAFVACADLNPAAAERQSQRYGIAARTIDALLASPDVDIVLNLTNPHAHADVALAALSAGKHVYSEKPVATTLADGAKILQAARDKGLRVGSAPDTVLGPGIQQARQLIDTGAIGKPIMGVATVLSHGMEHWHPNPAFYFQHGGGPVFDMGPYYLTALVTLLGPVASVMAMGQIGFGERTITTPTSPFKGQTIKVETLTTVQALLEFQSGAQVTFLTSWDVWRHGMLPIELHGTTGSLRIPDPNWFGGDLEIAAGGGNWVVMPTADHRFGELNDPPDEAVHANYRCLGLAEMARAILDDRPHRASGDLALHVLAIMTGILESARDGKKVVVGQRCDRPAAFDEVEAHLVTEPSGPVGVRRPDVSVDDQK